MEEEIKQIVLLQDLGMRFPKETSKRKTRYGLYKCFCGVEFKAQINSIKRGNTSSCGCSNKKHGMSNHKLYSVWKDMKHRCLNNKRRDFKYYGGAGIVICDRWLKLENFIEDMAETYKDGLSIDRIDNSKGYRKDNCRWTTMDVQNRNKRKLISTNTSGYRGVSFNNKLKKYTAQIKAKGKPIYLGSFDTAINAAKAYNNYVIINNLEHTLNNLNVEKV